MPEELTHFDERGDSRMVDVSDKETSHRFARASGRVRAKSETLDRIRDQSITKGDVLGVARLAGIMAAKRTDELIPLCHSLGLDGVQIAFTFLDKHQIVIEAEVRVLARTGVEMEALSAVSVAALTIYDMCKSIDRTITIEKIQLEEKSGGRSGHFVREVQGKSDT